MFTIVEGISDALALRDWFDQQGVIALDTETTGFAMYEPDFRVRLIQFGNKSEAWVVPLEQWTGFVQELIDCFDGMFVIHNSRFDLESLRAVGITVPWHQVDDTMIAMRLAEPHRTAALKDVATRLVSASAADGQLDLHKAMKKNGWGWDTIPIDFPPYTFYAALDVILTARVYETATCESGLRSPLYRLEMDYRQLCTTMERNGMRIDVGFCKREMLSLTEELEAIKADVLDTHGFSLTSNPDFGKWLLTNGAPLAHLTKGGSPSVAKEALEEMLPMVSGTVEHVIRQTLRVRKTQKLVSSYFENFVNLSVDGLLHPSIETIAARTGRTSIRQPAIQQLPKGTDPDAAKVRRAVIPRNEDELMMSCDYNQIELRRIGAISKDQALIAAFKEADESGGDLFVTMTRMAYDDPTIIKSDPRRDPIKTLVYSTAYGAGLAKQAASAGLPVNEMRDISARLFGKYPGIKALSRLCEQVAKDNDYWISTPAGRRIWIDPDASYKAMNALIQGDAADIFKQAMVYMGHAGLEEMMVVPVHDEILMSVPKDIIEDVKPIVKDCMTNLSELIPLRAEPSAGAESWGALLK